MKSLWKWFLVLRVCGVEARWLFFFSNSRGVRHISRKANTFWCEGSKKHGLLVWQQRARHVLTARNCKQQRMNMLKSCMTGGWNLGNTRWWQTSCWVSFPWPLRKARMTESSKNTCSDMRLDGIFGMSRLLFIVYDSNLATISEHLRSWLRSCKNS